jgi:hypothetical protein
MGGRHRIGRALAIAAVCSLMAAVPAAAQTETPDTSTIPLTPTPECSQADIDQLQRVITFLRSKSWAEQPDKTAFAIAPDTAACRVVLKINKVSAGEQAALERGGEGRLSIERTKERAEPSRLPLLLWVVFGGAGLVFVFVRYGRR